MNLTREHFLTINTFTIFECVSIWTEVFGWTLFSLWRWSTNPSHTVRFRHPWVLMLTRIHKMIPWTFGHRKDSYHVGFRIIWQSLEKKKRKKKKRSCRSVEENTLKKYKHYASKAVFITFAQVSNHRCMHTRLKVNRSRSSVDLPKTSQTE